MHRESYITRPHHPWVSWNSCARLRDRKSVRTKPRVSVENPRTLHTPITKLSAQQPIKTTVSSEKPFCMFICVRVCVFVTLPAPPSVSLSARGLTTKRFFLYPIHPYMMKYAKAFAASYRLINKQALTIINHQTTPPTSKIRATHIPPHQHTHTHTRTDRQTLQRTLLHTC